MKQYNNSTPEGTRDLLFEECEVRRLLDAKIADLFSKWGYREVRTPGIEFYDVFTGRLSGLPPEQMYKLTDHAGRLIALRPDCTLPIARLAATRLKDALLPLRLYYTETVYQSSPSMRGRSDEFLQAGIELIGADGIRSDLEMIMLAIESLQCCEAPDFVLELGHAGFFTAIEEKLELDPDKKEQLHSFVEMKNYAALGDMLNSLPQSDAVKAMRMLPRMFGGPEIFDEADKWLGGLAREPLAYLRELYKNLCDLGLNSRIIIDLGLVHQNEYYSGVVFRGYMHGYGDTVLSGGRYDELLREYGRSLPATGFGINVDSLARALLKRGDIPKTEPPSVLVHGEEGFEIQAVLHARSVTEKNTSCEISVFQNRRDVVRYAAKRGISRVDFVGDEIQTMVVGEEENQ